MIQQSKKQWIIIFIAYVCITSMQEIMNVGQISNGNLSSYFGFGSENGRSEILIVAIIPECDHSSTLKLEAT